VKRWTLRILLCLILGAITTVAVASGHAIVWPLNIKLARSERIERSANPHWEVDLIQFQGGLMVISRAANGWQRPFGDGESAPSWSIGSRPPSAQDLSLGREVTETAYGWPLLSAFERVSTGRGVAAESTVALISRAFLIDAVFYAAVWFGLLFGFARLASAKRAIRRRRGRCPRCGYDLRGALENGCPECGWNRQSSDTP
jgi:hypothetical protein